MMASGLAARGHRQLTGRSREIGVHGRWGKTEQRLPPLTHKGLVLLARFLGDDVFAPHNSGRDPGGGAAVLAPPGQRGRLTLGGPVSCGSGPHSGRAGRPECPGSSCRTSFSLGASATSPQGRAGGRPTPGRVDAGLARPSRGLAEGPAPRPAPRGQACLCSRLRDRDRGGACRWEHARAPAEGAERGRRRHRRHRCAARMATE